MGLSIHYVQNMYNVYMIHGTFTNGYNNILYFKLIHLFIFIELILLIHIDTILGWKSKKMEKLVPICLMVRIKWGSLSWLR